MRQHLPLTTATIIVASFVGWFCWMIFDNAPPYIYYAEQSHVKPNPSQAGHQVEVHWQLRVNRLCPGWIVRTIVDAKTGARFSYDPTRALGTVRPSDSHLDRSFFLPDGIRPGPKLYRVNAEYICNPLHHIWPLKVQTPDLLFEVTN